MASAPVSQRIQHLADITAPVIRFMTSSRWARHDPTQFICDFVVGNPHEMPLTEFVEALQRWTPPQGKDWFAYKMSEPSACDVVAESLRARHELPFMADDVLMTNGAFAGLSVALRAVCDPGDEVVFISPPWFFYETLIAAVDATPVRVRVHPHTFDLDLDAIEAALTPRTRAIIVNSPHNPTGKIYPPETLQKLGHCLDAASAHFGRPIYLLSDEAYSRIVFDGRDYPSPTRFYHRTILIYTYGKVLLTPGQRVGYLALTPTLPDKGQVYQALMMAQLVTGYAWPNALLQHALPDLERASIDIAHLQRKRDRLVAGLRGLGYEVTVPEGTFYVLARSPWTDDLAFLELLAEYGVYCLPGAVVEMPGYFRISLTASDEMIDRALPGFGAALEQATQAAPVPDLHRP